MKKILIINGHPNKDSLCTAFANSYYKGALKLQLAQVGIVHLYDLHF